MQAEYPVIDFNDLPGFQPDLGYVYFLTAKKQVKIGTTVDLKKRFKQLKSTYKKVSRFNVGGFRSKFKVRGFIEYPANRAWRIETTSHLVLSHLRVNGDWFKTDLDTAFRVVRRVAQGGIPYEMAIELGLERGNGR